MGNRSVAVIAAHPDDEVLLAGGAMARHVADGDRVAVLILATGLAARTDGMTPAADALARLRDEGLLTVVAAEEVIRIIPPLIVEEAQVDEALAILDRVAGACAKAA